MTLEGLKAKCEAATAGPWEYDDSLELGHVWQKREHCKSARILNKVDHEFIASANPQVVLALIACANALKHTEEFCLCTRNTKGFDYGEAHPEMGKPKIGARWLTPRDTAEKALAQLNVALEKERG